MDETPYSEEPASPAGEEHRPAAPARPAGGRFSTRPPWLVPAIILGLVAVLGIGLGVGTLVAGKNEAPAPSGPTEAYGATVTVVGEKLPTLTDAETDPAVGQVLPRITGTDFAGNSLTIANDGRPKLIVALAHWCPYCNAEAPTLIQWYGAGSADGVEVYSLHVFADPERDHYPPATWVSELGWNMPLIADDAGKTLVRALGIPAVPFWLLVTADGSVAWRHTGQLDAAALDQIVAMLAGSTTTVP